MPSNQRLVDEIIRTHWAVLNAMQTSSRPDWMELEMTMAQIKALFVVSQRQGTSITQIAEYLGIGQPTTSQLVDKLVRNGFAERSEAEKDRRIKLVRLTDQGRDLVKRLYQGGEDSYREWLAKMSQNDLLALRRGLQALANIAHPPSSE